MCVWEYVRKEFEGHNARDIERDGIRGAQSLREREKEFEGHNARERLRTYKRKLVISTSTGVELLAGVMYNEDLEPKGAKEAKEAS